MTKQVIESGLDLHTSMREAPRSAEAEAFSSGERLCFDSVDYGVMIVDDCLDIQVWNRWMVDHSQVAADQAVNRPMQQVLPGMPELLRAAVVETIQSGLSNFLSSRLHQAPLPLFASTQAQQRNQRMQQTVAVIPFQRGAVTCALVQVSDRSRANLHEFSLKQTMLELETLASRAREQESQLQNILNNTLDAIIILNKHGRISGFYKSAQKLFGYSAYELLGKPLSVLFPPPHNRRFSSIIDNMSDDPSLEFQEQVKALRSSGVIFHAEVAVSTILEDADLEFIVTVKDVTERYLAQEALYREKEQAQVTLSSIADGVITTDIIGQINYVNPAALKLTGYHYDELINHKIDRVITIESDRDALPVYECIDSGVQVDSISGDVLIAKDGEQVVIHQVASPIHNQTGDIIGVVLIFRDVSKSHRLASRLSWQASHDELTELVNRREFERRLEVTIESSRRDGSEHCICFLDLDKFKVVNDTCGHVAGDELLRQLAQIFKSKIRDADTLARLGGDEFAVILKKCRVGPAVNVAEEIRAAVEEFRFGWDDQSFQIGVSIGLVVINADSPDLDEVFRAADSACYAAKAAGRNRVHLYSPDDEEISQRRGEAHWMVRIQNALELNRFALHYQPIVPVNAQGDDAQVHYEILLRLIGDDGELIPPGAFLSAAERYQMMARVDRWVIENLFKWMDQHWDYAGHDIFAINLSGQSLVDENLLYRIRKLFDEYAVPAQRICFEITETAAISNLSKAQLFIKELKQLGCLFALDDFGSGLSSFAYLKSLNVDYLKIDGAFIKDMVDDPIDRAMVESIHNIGTVLELQTIAEFVENDAIFNELKRVGVDFAQGYGIARPQPLPADGRIDFKLKL